MNTNASPRQRSGRLMAVGLALLAGILGLLFIQGDVQAVIFQPSYVVDQVDPNTSDDTADIVSHLEIPADVTDSKANSIFGGVASFTPRDWGLADPDLPIGAWVGKVASLSTLGLLVGPCDKQNWVIFDMMLNASLDTTDTVSFDDGFKDVRPANGVPDGADRYPEFLNEVFPGLEPIARTYGQTSLAGINVALQFLQFKPGTRIPGAPSFSADRGYPQVTVINDPTAPLTPGAITDFCAPNESHVTTYGLSKDNPKTAGVDESGYAVRTNPPWGGTYRFWTWIISDWDSDDDDIENGLDSCPHLPDPHRLGTTGDADYDGLFDSCDPDDADYKTDPDGDKFPNYQDNCPLVPNGLKSQNPAWDNQADSDGDGIGDACDDDDWNADGDITDPGEPTGFRDNVADGERIELWLSTDIEIEGPERPTPTAEDRDGDGWKDADEEALGSDPDDPLSTPEHVTVEGTCTDGKDNDKDGLVDAEDPGCAATPTPTPPPGTPTPTPTPTPIITEFCSPVIPGTYHGLVRINGRPAASGYKVTASIGDTQWGSAIVSGGRYALDIPQPMPVQPPCFQPGSIVFELNGMTCSPSPDWEAGLHNVDLACAPPAPTPTLPPATPPPGVTPTPTITPTPTPRVTPVKPPPTGGGGLAGPGLGLPLWAMALASSVALVTVAGLGTLVAARVPSGHDGGAAGGPSTGWMPSRLLRLLKRIVKG